MDQPCIYSVCAATVISRLTYAISAWWGFISAQDKQRLQAVLNRAIRWSFYDKAGPTIAEICSKQDIKLFHNVLSNPYHVLHQFLPPEKHQAYCLRPRAHNRELPKRTSSLISKNFLTRILYSSLTQQSHLVTS